MASGLPPRITLLTYEEIRRAERMCIDGRPHRELLPVLTAARRLARRADNGSANAMVSARSGMTDDEMMEAKLQRDARQARLRRRAQLAVAAD